MLTRRRLPEKISCAQVWHICARHGRHIFLGVHNHLETCTDCKIDAIIEKAATMQSEHLRARSTARYFMRLFVKRPDMSDESKKICKGFLIQCENWDVKIHYSRHLTRIEVAESIFNAILSVYGVIRPSMRWPTRSYTDKYERRNRQRAVVRKQLPNVSPEEAENDELFQTAACLGEEFLAKHAEDPESLLRLLEVYRVFIT